MKELYRIYISSYQGLSRNAWMLAIVMLINRTGTMVLPFLGIYMANELGFNIGEVGIVLACFGLGAVIGSWFGGWLTDKFGNFWVQSISLLVSVPLFLVVPQFSTIQGLAAIILVLSIVTESFRPANSVSVARYAKPENITRAFSLNRMAINLGFSIGPAVGGILATISYAWIFYGNALGALLAAIVFIWMFYDKKPNTNRSVTPIKVSQQAESHKSPYRDIKFLLFNLLCCFYAICFFQLLSTMPLFYQSHHGMNEKQIGMLLGFSGVIIVLTEMVIVHVAERRMSYTTTITLGTLIGALSFVLLALPGGYWILYASIFVLSMSEILAMPFMASVVVKRSSKQTLGAYMGLNSLAFSAAHVFSPYLGTRVAAQWGFASLWIGTAALLVLTSFGFYWLIKKM